jgi:hypothetical protein
MSTTVGMLRSRRTFRFGETQRSKGSSAGNFDFDEMDATWFANGHTFVGEWAGGSNFKPRLKSHPWRSTLESPELRERLDRAWSAAPLESAIAQRCGHRLGRFLQMSSQP